MEALSRTIYHFLSNHTCPLYHSKTGCKQCINSIERQLIRSISYEEDIHFILPAFPAKSANREKTLACLPDYGETLALERLTKLADVVNKATNKKVNIIICSDGHIFSDVVGVTEKAVERYQDKLLLLAKKKCLTFFNLKSAYPRCSTKKARELLLANFAKSIEEIKLNCRQSSSEKKLFNGLHRFLYEDMRSHYAGLSNNQIKKIAKARTYETIRRSHAWSDYLTDKFPNAVRLSIHPHACGEEKIAINLIPESPAWATPWHNVVVKIKNRFMLMKNKEAIAMNATLVNSKQGAYYEL